MARVTFFLKNHTQNGVEKFPLFFFVDMSYPLNLLKSKTAL